MNHSPSIQSGLLIKKALINKKKRFVDQKLKTRKFLVAVEGSGFMLGVALLGLDHEWFLVGLWGVLGLALVRNLCVEAGVVVGDVFHLSN